jgi:hypothetical protein
MQFFGVTVTLWKWPKLYHNVMKMAEIVQNFFNFCVLNFDLT